MSFTTLTWPWMLAGLGALAALLFLLQRLRIRHREVVVPSTLFWRAAAEEAPARTLVERFRHPWAYALILLICALLWLAFGNPTAEYRADTTLHVAVLDGSATMMAGSRFDDAVSALRAHVRTLPPAQRQVLWSAGELRTLLNPGEHELLLARRLARLRPQAAPGGLDNVLRSLSYVARPERPVSVTIFGDSPLRISSNVESESLRVTRVASSSEEQQANHGIVALGMAETASGTWSQVDVYFEIAGNAAAGPVPEFQVALDGTRLPPDRILPFARGEAAGYLVAGLPAAGGLLEIRLLHADTIAVDDSAQLRLPDRPRVRVQLAPSLEVLRAALTSDPVVELVGEGGQVAIRRRGEDFGAGLPALEFVDRSAPAAFSFVHPPRFDAGTVLHDAVEATGLREVDATALAASARQAIEVAVTPGPRWEIRVWADLLTPDFNFLDSRAFPLFLSNSIRWLAQVPGIAPYAAAGRPLVRETPDSAPRPLGPEGRALDVLGDVFIPTQACTLEIEGQAEPLVVSLLDATTTTASGLSADADVPAASFRIPHHPATWLLLLALVLLLAEWRLFHLGRVP